MIKGIDFDLQVIGASNFGHIVDKLAGKMSGVTKGCEVTNSGMNLTVAAGYMLTCGRLTQIIGTETVAVETVSSGTTYACLVYEVDLSKVNTTLAFNQGVLKVVTNNAQYPTLTQDDLDEHPDDGVFQLPLARFTVTVSGIGNLTDARYVLEFSQLNRNLLDNPLFTVNQRGVTTYSVGSYGVDRWKLISGSATVSNNKITLNGTLRQILENSIGTSFTASVICESGTATVSYDDTNKYFDIVSSGGVIKAVKLELGSISTLANDSAPNYVEELEKCKRYFERIDYGAYGTVGIFSRFDTTNDIPIYYSEKRVVPTFNMVGTYQAVYPSSAYNVTVYGVEMSTKTSTRIITSSNGSTNTGYIRANGGNGNYMDISADL